MRLAAVGAPEQAHRKFGAAGAHQAGDADDLAAIHRDVDAVDHDARRVLRMVRGPVLHAQNFFADRGGVVGVAVFEIAAHHVLDHAILGDVVLGDGLDDTSVTDDSDGVADLLDLVELVGNDDGADALGLEAADQPQQVSGILIVECGGGFVEDEELHPFGERLGDLHELLFADAQLHDRGGRALPQSHSLEQRDGFMIGLVPIDEPVLPLDLVVEEDVLGNRKVGAQRQLLVDDHDALGFAVPDVAERHRLALEDNVALVAAVRVDPAQHVHEGGLAGAVLPANRVDLAAPHGEGDVLKRFDSGEGLRYRPHFQDVRRHFSHLFLGPDLFTKCRGTGCRWGRRAAPTGVRRAAAISRRCPTACSSRRRPGRS